MPVLGLVLAGLAACCSAGAAVLQGISARKVHTRNAPIVRLLREPAYLIALALIATGFGLTYAALRTLPLFVVQSIRASSLALTALIVVTMGARLTRTEVLGLVVATAGLVGIGLSAQAAPAQMAGPWVPGVLLGAAVAIVAAGAVVLKMLGERAGVPLAVLAGLGFATLATGAHIMSGDSLTAVLTDPAAWAAGFGGLAGLGLGALAYARAGVVPVTAAIVATETLTGSVAGILLAGDRPVPGREVLAAVGFVAALAGALVLARFGSVTDLAGRQMGSDEPVSESPRAAPKTPGEMHESPRELREPPPQTP